MNILIIDGQGGKLGKLICEAFLSHFPECTLTAVGTNSIATSNMLKAGIKNAATGENAIKVASRKADIIVGPVGIVVADALLGEITPEAANAVGQSDAKKILLPVNRCDILVAGTQEKTLPQLVSDTIQLAEKIIKN